METHYFEAYNRDNVHLVDISETPIVEVTETGLRTTERDYDFDIIVYATGFDAITGAFDHIDIQGVGGAKLRDKWNEGPSRFLGMFVHGRPEVSVTWLRSPVDKYCAFAVRIGRGGTGCPFSSNLS